MKASEDVQNSCEQARHILLDKRAELRKLLGKQRVAYTVSEMELVSSFRFRHPETDALIDERHICQLASKS